MAFCTVADKDPSEDNLCLNGPLFPLNTFLQTPIPFSQITIKPTLNASFIQFDVIDILSAPGFKGNVLASCLW